MAVTSSVIDLVDGDTDPSAPASGSKAIYVKNGVATMQDSAGVKTPLVNGVSAVSAADTSVVVTPTTGAVTVKRSPITGDVSIPDASNSATIPSGTVTDAKSALSVKPACTVVATSNQALTGIPVIDGQATASGSIILLTAQSTGAENGPWVAAAGSWSRPTWYPSGGTTQAFQFITTLIRLGTVYQGSVWRMTTSGAIIVDTTSTTWVVTPKALNSSTVVGSIPVNIGGTNSTTPLSNGRVMKSLGGAIVESAAITANRALTSDSVGIPVANATTDTELAFVSGVTSAIQTQLNNKQPLDSDLTAIAALSTTAYGRALLTLADAAALTAANNLATSSLKGMQAPADKARQDNLALGIFNVRDYGALGNDDGTGTGGQDDTTFIQAAIAAAAARKGGVVFFPAGYYKITATLIVQQSNVELVGVGGGGYTADTGNFRDVMSSALIWRGAAGQVMVDVSPTTGASATALKGFGFRGLALDGRDFRNGTDVGAVQAGTGLRLRSCHGFNLTNFYIQDCATVGLDLGVLTAGSLGEAQDCTRGLIERFCIRQLDGTVTPGIGVRLTGSSTANACCNRFSMGQIMYSGSNTNKPAMQLQNSDSNSFENIFCNRSGVSTTNWGIEIFGSSSGATEVSRANIFKNCSPGANGMIAAGTAAGKRPDGTLDATYNFTNPSRDNFAYPLNTENGEPVPFVGTGASFDYGISGGSTGVSFPGAGATLAVKLTPASIANTETQVVSITLPANFMRAGTTFRIKAGGLATNTTTISSSIPRIRIGASSLTGNIPASITAANGAIARTNIPFDMEALVTVQAAGAAGTIFGWITLNLHNATAPVISAPVTAAVAVDTTAIRVLELSFISGAASTSYNFTAASIELLKF